MSIVISGGGGAGGGGATNLNGLSDVNITSVSNGQILSYNNTSGQWENQTGVTGGLTYKGAFNATAGTPSLTNAVQGDFYIIDTAGTIYGQTWNVGDHLLINEDMGGSITNSKIDKVDNTDQVTSVNGATGAVTGLLEAGNNLSDLVNIPTARSNLGAIAEVVEDTTPQLGGPLDVNGNSIVSVSAGNIAITPDTTGSIVLDGLNWPQADGSADQVLKTNGSGQLSFVDQTSGLQDVVDDTTPQLGGPLDVNGQAIVSASAGNIAITPDTTGYIVLDGLNWPQADGTTGQVLKTDGAGNLGWVTAAGGLSAVVDDTTPQLGGPLDVNGNSIVSASAGNIAITPDTTGSIVLDGLNWPQADGTTGQVLQTNGAGQLSFVDQTSGLQDVVDDTTPQLGGDLDVQARIITTSTANGSIGLEPDGTGSVVARGTGVGNTPGTVTLNCEQNSHGVALQSPPHSAAASYTLKLPTGVGTSGQALTTDGNNPAQLSWADAGGLADVVDDTTPQLGGPLDVNGQAIVSVSAGNIAITPDTTGSIVLDGQNWPQADGTTGQYLSTNGAGQLSWVTAAGAARPTVYSVSANTTIGADTSIGSGELERIYIVDTTSAVTMTLPQITGNVGNGYKLNIKRDGGNTATITPNAADNIDGGTDGASITLDVDKASFTLVCDGTNWQII